ncbi:MAG TPA: hypothetical protein QF564_10835 [Pirellulaceae bacterium]|nr:hypothetical protein [Pirellulaceae bacterium]
MKKTIGSWMLVIVMTVAGPGVISSIGCGGNLGDAPTGTSEEIDEEDEEAGEAEMEAEEGDEGDGEE